jgi:hypothetical protein
MSITSCLEKAGFPAFAVTLLVPTNSPSESHNMCYDLTNVEKILRDHERVSSHKRLSHPVLEGRRRDGG